MRIKIIKPGVLTTIQDRGRNLYLSDAVPVSGCMDSLSARISNIAIDNDEDCAVLEFTYGNSSFITETPCIISYAGSGGALIHKETILPSNRPLFIPQGKLISIVHKTSGSRVYVAIKGGFNVEPILGSRSTFLTGGFGGFKGRRLSSGDQLESLFEIRDNDFNSQEIKTADWSINHESLLPETKNKIRVVKGREANWFTDKSVSTFFSDSFYLSLRSNRMGIHLEGPLIERKAKKELLSTAVTPGTIQVTGEGRLILLMQDCQTTGGYPRIGNVASVDLALCGQLKAGDQITFEEISFDESLELYLQREKQLLDLAKHVKNKMKSFHVTH